MDTEALIELHLRMAGWKPSERGEGLWDHGSANLCGIEQSVAQDHTQEWEDAAFDDDGPEPDCED